MASMDELENGHFKRAILVVVLLVVIPMLLLSS